MRLNRLVASLSALTALLSTGVPSGTASGAATASKKGVASAKYIWSDPAKLVTAGAAWTYGWSPYVRASTARLETVPMVWGAKDATAQVATHLRLAALLGTYHYLLGFNEPDMAQQADLTPTEAADLWPKLQSTGLKLGSPAPAVATNGWLARFMALAAQRRLRVDFIALHFYADFTNPNAVATIKDTIARVHARYGKPIWVTEIGTIDTRSFHQPMLHAPSVAAAQRFMRSAVAMLNGLSYVQRYAWFSDNVYATPAYHWSSLYNGRGRLTALGTTFQQLR